MPRVSAAVAIIQAGIENRSYLILRRASHPEDPWSGHYSFPGGRFEESDRDLFHTCTRETYEETGVLLQEKQLATTLPTRAAGAGNSNLIWVQPYLFILENKPNLFLDTSEIQSSIWLQEQDFQVKTNHIEREMVPGKIFPAYPINDYYLWGFTYGLLLDLTSIA